MNIFEKNCLLLKQKYPQLARRVQSSHNDANVFLRKSKTGLPILLIQTETSLQALHHPDDPAAYDLQFINSIQGLKETRNFAILGCGLGYIPQLILQQNRGLQNLFILEPSLSVFRMALQIADFSDLLGASETRFIVGSEPGEIYQTFSENLMPLLANPMLLSEIPAFSAAFPTWANRTKIDIQEVYRFGQSGLLTKFKDGPRCLQNLANNLATIIESPGINSLGDKFANIPAIIVAAGPSLAKNISLLKETHDQFVIIATDTTFELLLANQIIPHFVMTVDPTELNIRHFKQNRYETSSILLFDAEARPEIAAKFPQKMSFTTDKHPFFSWLDKTAGGKGLVQKGSMVSQAAFHVAKFWGCSPIIFIGQDLALNPESGGTHIPEAAIYRMVKYLEDDMHHVDVPVPFQEETMSREPLYWVEGIDGKPVPTIQSFMIYLRMLEDDIRKTKTPVINATEGGAKIQGAEIATLRETLQKYQNAQVRVSTIIDSVSKEPAQSQITDAIKKNLWKLIADRKTMAEEGTKTIESNPDINLRTLQQKISEYQNKIFSDPVGEYLIEYAAPKELFDFLKLGPANADLEGQKTNAQNRLNALLQATITAEELLKGCLGG